MLSNNPFQKSNLLALATVGLAILLALYTAAVLALIQFGTRCGPACQTLISHLGGG